MALDQIDPIEYALLKPLFELGLAGMPATIV